MLAPVAAVGWFFLALLGLLVGIALFPKQRTEGAASILWGLGFALFLWFGVWTLGVRGLRAILFALVAGLAIALFVYLRGAALENPPVEQPGVFQRRLLARRRAGRGSNAPYQPYAGKTRELVQAQAALVHGELDAALYSLREAERVAVAQRKLGELLEVRELVSSVSARSTGRTKEAGEALARDLTARIYDFPADQLASVGIHKESDRELLDRVLARGDLRAAVGDETKTRELSRARRALDDGELASALFSLQEAERVGVAQRRLGELLEVYALVQVLSERSSGRTRTASVQLAARVEAGLRSFA